MALLTPRNPLSHHIQEDEWVHCRHGWYCDNIGIVCGHVLSSDAEVIVAFIPQIPNVTPVTAKRKRVSRPKP